MATYEIGDVIEQRTSLGLTRFVRVETIEANVKDGLPGFSGVEVNEQGVMTKRVDSFSGVWGYDNQVVRVVKRLRWAP